MTNCNLPNAENAFGDGRGLEVVAGDWLVQAGSEEVSCSVSASKSQQDTIDLVTATQLLSQN